MGQSRRVRPSPRNVPLANFRKRVVGLTRAFVAARDELSALSFPPSRAVSVLGRCGLPLCSFVLRSLPHGAASPPFYRQTEVERHRRERGRVERPRRGSGHPSAVRPVGQTSSSETRSSSQCALITRQHWCHRRPRGSADRLLFLGGPQAQRLLRSFYLWNGKSVAYLDRDSDCWWVSSYSVPPGAIVVTEGYHFGGCLFTASSLMSAPQPGFVGMIR